MGRAPLSSLHRVGRIEAIDERGPVEELLVQLYVLRDAPQLVEMLAADHRVLFLERLLVLDRLRLHVIDLRLAALARVEVEHIGLGAAEPDIGDLGREIHGVVDAAVHAHAADRIVDVGAVAGEQDAALVEGRGHALMHGIERVIRDFVSALPGVDALQAALDALHAQGLFVGFLRRDRHDAAPDSGWAVALDLEQVEPFVRVGKIIAGAKAAAGRAEVEAGADLDEALGPGETLELDLRQPPHGAAPAIGADDVAAANFFALAGGVGGRHIDVAGADHDHPIIALHHPLQIITLYIPIRSLVTTRQRWNSGRVSRMRRSASACRDVRDREGAKRCTADPGPPRTVTIHAS